MFAKIFFAMLLVLIIQAQTRQAQTRTNAITQKPEVVSQKEISRVPQKQQNDYSAQYKRCLEEKRNLENQINDLKNTIGKLDSQLSRARNQIEELRSANSASDRLIAENKRLRDQLSRFNDEKNSLEKQISSLKNDNDKLSARLKDADREISRLRTDASSSSALIAENNRLKDQLNRASREAASFKSDAANFKSQADGFRAERDKLSVELASARQDVTNWQSQYNALKSQSQNQLNAMKTQSQNQIDALKTQSQSNLNQTQNQLRDAQNQLSQSGETSANLSGQLGNLTDQQKTVPAMMAGRLVNSAAESLQAQSVNGSPIHTTVVEKDGKITTITDLVIGRLEVKHDKEIETGKPSSLNATFTPHQVLDSKFVSPLEQQNINWWIELDYKPLRLNAAYDSKSNNGKAQKRALNLNSSENWSWVFTPEKGFKKEESPLRLTVSYSIGGSPEISKELPSENVALFEKEEPGLVLRTWQFVKENLTYILGVITTILAILGGVVSNKKNKLETKLKEMEVERALNKKDDNPGGVIVTP